MSTLLYITNRVCDPGGLERVLSIKATYLADFKNYEVHIVTLHQDDQTPFYEFSPKIKFHHLNLEISLLSYFKNYRKEIKSVIKQVDPDIILVCDDGFKGLIFPLLIGKTRPLIYERHTARQTSENQEHTNFLTPITYWFKDILVNWCVKKFDYFVVLTSSNLKEWNSSNLEVISNPLSFYPEESSTLQNKKVIAVGKHCFQKGYDRLLKSWEIVIRKFPDWTLEIYGSSNKDHDLIGLAQDLNIQDSVKFHAPVKNIKEKYLEASLLALSSRIEGFGMVLIEAMACGLPTVSFDCPRGPRDIIREEDGILIKDGDIDAFAQALISVIGDDSKRIEMGRMAKENVKRYLPGQITSQWEKLFQNLMQKG